MKVKEVWKRRLCMALTAVLLVTLPGMVSGAQDETVVEWTYDDSILVHVEVDESRTFLPEDFPGIACKKVFVLEKKQKEKGFEYKLVLLLKDSGDEILDEAISKAEKLSMVVGAERNGAYVQQSVLRLNHSCIYLAVNETASLFIKDLVLHAPEKYQIYGVKYTLNLPVYNPAFIDKDSFSDYGISHFWPETEDGDSVLVSQPTELEGKKSADGVYYGISKEETTDIFNTAERLAGSPKFLNVAIVSNTLGLIIVTEEENWNIKNTEIAECSLSGGTTEGEHVLTPLNQNAVIRGLKPGITTLICDRKGREGIASAKCTVICYEPGSKNNPGDMDHNGVVDVKDALQTLKHSVGLVSLNEADKQAADLNQDSAVDERDALLMLKIDVGIL